MQQIEEFLQNIHLPWATIVAYGISLLSLIWILAFYCPKLRKIYRTAQACDEKAQEEIPHYIPPVSVVIYARDQTDSLEKLLPQIMEQEFPAPFEIIVVNEGQSESTKEMVEHLQLQYPNIYLTFTPEGARNLSRKKLGLTLGVKAARHEVLVLTNADAEIPSKQWLRLMSQPMLDPTIEVVLGYAQFNRTEDNTTGCRTRAFNYAADSVPWLLSAIEGKPYRGTSYCLAYRRDTFFKNKGFSRSLNLHNGDDDIFVNEITNPKNTYVQLAEDARVQIDSWNIARAWSTMKRQYDFTGARLPMHYRRLFGFSSLMFWLWLICSILAVVFALPFYLIPTIAVAASAIALWIPVIITWGKLLEALGSRNMRITIIWGILSRPFVTLVYKILGFKTKKKNYTWH